MIGTHNSFSYLRPTKWWGRLLSPWAKCQSQTIGEQIRMGVRYFDLRVAYDKSLNLRVVHNTVDFPSEGLYSSLEDINSAGGRFYLRIVLDMRKEPKNGDRKNKLLEKFMDLCNGIKRDFLNITIDKIIIGWNWQFVYDKGIKVAEWHASVRAEWYEYLWGTQCWAEIHNGEINHYMPDTITSEKEAVLVDYVEYM